MIKVAIIGCGKNCGTKPEIGADCGKDIIREIKSIYGTDK